jgi:hypothetical protein
MRVRLSLLLALACLLSTSPAPAARAADCSVFGLISASITWSPASCPVYIVTGNITVDTGVTLTMAPGTVVKFNAGRDLIVRGTLVARGTAGAGILLSSNLSPQQPGDWGQVSFAAGSVDGTVDAAGGYSGGSALEYVTVEYAGGGGAAAVQSADSSPLINRSTFRKNKVQGLRLGYNPGFLTRVTNSRFEENGALAAADGGALLIEGDLIADPNDSRFLVVNNVFRNNRGFNGGAVHLKGGEGLLSNNTFSGNRASNGGGALYVGPAYRGTITVSANTFRGNSSTNGGAINTIGDTTALYGNIVVENEASQGGGGIAIALGGFTGRAALVGNLISQNRDGQCGGGVQIFDAIVAPLRDNAFVGNTTAGVPLDLCNYNYDYDGNTTAEGNWWGTSVRSAIGERIFDNVDDTRYTLVDFEPFRTAALSAQGSLTAAGGGSLSSPDGKVKVSLPKAGLSADAAISLLSTSTPGVALPATSKLLRSVLLSALSADGTPPQLLKPASISIGYTPAELAAAGLSEASLNVAAFDGQRWVNLLPCAGCGVDTAGRQVTVAVSGFTQFALVGTSSRVYLPALRR